MSTPRQKAKIFGMYFGIYLGFAIELILSVSGCSIFTQKSDFVDIQTYHKTVARFTVNRNDYQGFYNTYQYNATLLNSEVSRQQLAILSQAKTWLPTKFKEEKEKQERLAETETRLFLSFFTPSKQDNKFVGNTAVWKIVLQVGDEKFEGQVSPSPLALSDLLLLYPYHNRWSKPYNVIFKIPRSKIEGATPKLIVSGSLGISESTF